MINGFKRAALATVLATSLLGAALPAFADDLAERRRLANELVTIVPYDDKDAEADVVKEVTTALRKKYGERFTPYAEQEAVAAGLEAWRKAPSISQMTRELLGAKLTVEELREAIVFTRSPLAAKTRTQPPQAPTESQEAYIARLFTPQEFDAFVAMVSTPGIRKYMATIQEAATPMGETFGEDLFSSLQARCAKPTAPLPWCQ